MREIKISLDHNNGDNLSVLRVDGVVDTMTATELEKVMNSLISQKRYRIVVDLGGVDYISSAGWGIFVSNIREVRANKGDIKLVRMVPGVYEVFELLEFDSILRSFDSLEKAKEDFGMAAATGLKPGSNPSVFARESRIKTEPSPPVSKTVGLEETLMALISEDPFYSIGELKDELSRRGCRVSFWGLVRLLWAKKLFSAKSRFRFARSAARRGLRFS